MKKHKNRQKVKELLREFLKNLRGLLEPKIDDLVERFEIHSDMTGFGTEVEIF